MMVAPPAAGAATPHQRPLHCRVLRALAVNRERLHPRLRLLQLMSRLLPVNMFGRARSSLLRLAGARIGGRTFIYGAIDLHGAGLSCTRLEIGRNVWISPHCSIDLSAAVRIGDDVAFGHDVVIITADHELGPPEHRCGPLAPRPVVIGRGAWIGARSTILPGVTVGPGSVVSAGSTVYHNVPPNTAVAGSPARAIRGLAPRDRVTGDEGHGACVMDRVATG